MDHITSLDGDELARACAEEMSKNDHASRGLGMKIADVAAGRAVLEMKVRRDMTNGHGICHGGYIFLLADSAFAYACNSYNQITLAQHCSVDFLKPAREGDILTAIASERQRTGRSGIYDVSVMRQGGETIAEFRGNSRTIKGQTLPES